jgi:hypothetical protein
MTIERRRPKKWYRRLERWMVGIAMGIMAFVLEKAVMHAVKKGEVPKPPEEPKEPPPTTVTSKGGAVDL